MIDSNEISPLSIIQNTINFQRLISSWVLRWRVEIELWDAISANVEGKIELLSNPVMEEIFCSKAIGFKNTYSSM